ncbi:hypothetical protein [Brevundimonas nasdae]|uniref:hypothetical protein n=1 Tax=Brevundimonas nasdae TaxID=172043 RepID=UPI000689B483|nr:hypothetical protein [Brevundimonas nasdae]
MGTFEFFFSFYGLVLGLSVAVIATALATSIQHRAQVRMGWLTPMLALFVCLDIVSFWSNAWDSMQTLPVTYGLLVASLTVALTYFVACSLIFPHQIVDGANLDDHFWSNKRIVLVLMIAATLMSYVLTTAGNLRDPAKHFHIIDQGIGVALYLLLVGLAAQTKRPGVFAVSIGIYMFYYAITALATALLPTIGTVSAS